MNKKSFFILFLIIAVFASCEDKDNYSAPVIDSVKKSVKVSEIIEGNLVEYMEDQEIQEGELGEWIFIDGSNFYDVQEINFNDISVSLSSAYITPKRISICIPRYAPNEITNKIMIVTAHGTAVKEFTIDVPPLIIEGLLNEYVNPEGTGYIVGDNFDIYQVDSLEGAWLEIDRKRIRLNMVNSKLLKFTVPEDIEPGAEFRIFRNDEEGNLLFSKRVPGYYRDSRYMFYDFSKKEGHYNMEVTNGLGKIGYPDSIAGNYAVFVGDFDGGWGGAGGKFYFEDGMPIREYACFQGDYKDLVGDASRLQLVFEVNVMTDWVTVPMLITYNNYWYFWRPHLNVAYKTSDWTTIRIPLKEFKDKDGTGEPWSEFKEEMATNWGPCYRRVLLTGAAQKSIFICIDNIRFAPIDE